MDGDYRLSFVIVIQSRRGEESRTPFLLSLEITSP